MNNLTNDVTYKDEYGHTMLHFACHCHDFERVSFLINNGAEVNCYNIHSQTPLLLVTEKCGKDTAKIVKILLENGAYSDCKSYMLGETPLMKAACHGCLETVSLLHHHNKNLINQRDNKGKTAVIKAFEYNQLHVAAYLLNNGATFDESEIKDKKRLCLLKQEVDIQKILPISGFLDEKNKLMKSIGKDLTVNILSEHFQLPPSMLLDIIDIKKQII